MRDDWRMPFTSPVVEKTYEPPFARQQPVSAVANASFMMCRIVRAHRPHWALQPRQP